MSPRCPARSARGCLNRNAGSVLAAKTSLQYGSLTIRRMANVRLMWQDLQAQLSGPGHLRFIIQPIVAILLGLKDAKLDVEAGRTPFILSLFRSENRRQLAEQALKQIAVPLAVATSIDAVLQYVIFGRVKVLSAFIIGAVLIALPYALSRALGNRALRRLRARHA
jgi:hypothetical protein